MAKNQEKTLRVGLAGLGTVGAGTFKILQANADLITRRTGVRIVVTAVNARNKGKDRGIDLSSVEWVDNPIDLASHPDVDVVVEAMGGENDPALSLVQDGPCRMENTVVTCK